MYKYLCPSLCGIELLKRFTKPKGCGIYRERSGQVKPSKFDGFHNHHVPGTEYYGRSESICVTYSSVATELPTLPDLIPNAIELALQERITSTWRNSLHVMFHAAGVSSREAVTLWSCVHGE